MNPAPGSVFCEPQLAAKPQLREKSRQGFETWKTAWKPGPNVANSTTAIGLRAGLVLEGVRKTYRARYYNPNSGRFMSRDPEDGKAKDPKTLHKYLYAGGDPINAVDPTGKGIIEYVWTNVRSAALGVLEGHKYGEIVLCLLQFVNDRMLAVYLGLPFSGVGMPDWDLQACLELAGML